MGGQHGPQPPGMHGTGSSSDPPATVGPMAIEGRSKRVRGKHEEREGGRDGRKEVSLLSDAVKGWMSTDDGRSTGKLAPASTFPLYISDSRTPSKVGNQSLPSPSERKEEEKERLDDGHQY